MNERCAAGSGLPVCEEVLSTFRHPEQARRSFRALQERLSAELYARLPDLLSGTPDADSALMMLERLVAESKNEIAEALNRSPALIHYAVTIFGHGPFLGETLLRNSDFLVQRGRGLDRSYSREEFQQRLNTFRSQNQQKDLSTLLAAFKKREYLRISLRDCLKIASLAETTNEISTLSDVLLGEALGDAELALRARYGDGDSGLNTRTSGQRFAILSLGKLGGSELNYSSDVDLLYLFRDREPVAGVKLSTQEYFIRLAQRVTDILSRATTEGPVFRIDLRLRPRGSDGELAISLEQALLYYTQTAHDWELQALIKARHSAGDSGITSAFVKGVQPHVYTEVVNFRAIKTALVAREKMHQMRRLHSKPSTIDVKVGHGGIRDIEFLVQCLQRIYGGREPWLRSRGTLFALQKLYDKGHLSEEEFQRLSSAYEFLRHLEHRLQLRHGRQTHELPAAADELCMLRRSMEPYLDSAAGEDLVSLVKNRMAAVSEIYKRVILQQQARETEQLPEFVLLGGSEVARVEATDQEIVDRLATDSPRLHAIATRQELEGVTRRNLFRFLSAALTSSERYASVLRHAETVERALLIFAESEFLTEILVRHPEELSTLSQIETSWQRPPSEYLFDRVFGDRCWTRDPVFAYVQTSQSLGGEKLSLLRRHYRHRIFAEGARDLLGFRDIYDALSTTTGAAEDVIECVLHIAGNVPGLAVMALGRLGTREFDLGSDSDLLFVRAEESDSMGTKSAAERIVQILSAYTQDGSVFAVDTRLRPRGEEGELVVTVSQLEKYFAVEAQPWEALLFTKLRFVAGDARIGEQALGAAEQLFARFADFPNVVMALDDMRTKLEGIHGARNLKTAPGGTYDIDFITGYLLLKHGVSRKNGTLRERVWRCASVGLLPKRDAARLDHAAELMRTAEHAVRLVSGRPGKWLPPIEHARKSVEKLVEKMLQRSWRDGLEAELSETCTEVRSIYNRVFAEAKQSGSGCTSVRLNGALTTLD